MHHFSSLVKSPSSSPWTPIVDENDDNQSASTIFRGGPLPTPSLKIKRVDHYFSRWSDSRAYRVSCCDIVMYGTQLMYFLDIFVEHELQKHS